MERTDLHTRLETLGGKIDEAQARMRRASHPYHDRMHQKADELKDRYRELQARLNRDIADVEAQGRHVGDLERSVRQWLDSIDRQPSSPTDAAARPRARKRQNE